MSKAKVYVDLYLSNGIYSLIRMSDFTIFFSNVSFILEFNLFTFFFSFLGVIEIEFIHILVMKTIENVIYS